MKVLTFTSLFPNSIQPWHGIFVRQRIAHFAARGHCVNVIAPVPYAPRWTPVRKWREASRVPSKEEFDAISVYHPRYFLAPKVSMPFHGLLMFAGAVACAERLHRKESFDCIDAHYVYPDGFAAVLLGRRLGIPVVVSARGTDVTLFPTFPLIRRMIRWTFQQTVGIVAVCGALKQAIEALAVPTSQIATIGNGVDLDRFHPVDRSAARQRLGIAADAKVFLSVGNLVPVKGHEYLVRAITRVAARDPRAQLYIVGEGHLRASLEELTRSERTDGRVFFVGRKPNEEMKYWYSAADASCLASSREGWANVLLESLACGTPVVATRVWGTPEVIASDEVGILTEQGTDALARGMRQVLEKRWDAEAIVRYASARTWDVVALELEAFFNEHVLAKRDATREVIHA
jgi:teichuronic acid biosynthesis glycosyltransferase TuaC